MLIDSNPKNITGRSLPTLVAGETWDEAKRRAIRQHQDALKEAGHPGGLLLAKGKEVSCLFWLGSQRFREW